MKLIQKLTTENGAYYTKLLVPGMCVKNQT